MGGIADPGRNQRRAAAEPGCVMNTLALLETNPTAVAVTDCFLPALPVSAAAH